MFKIRLTDGWLVECGKGPIFFLNMRRRWVGPPAGGNGGCHDVGGLPLPIWKITGWETKKEGRWFHFLKWFYDLNFLVPKFTGYLNQFPSEGDHYVTSSKEMCAFFWNFKHKMFPQHYFSGLLFLLLFLTWRIVLYTKMHNLVYWSFIFDGNCPVLPPIPHFIWQSFFLQIMAGSNPQRGGYMLHFWKSLEWSHCSPEMVCVFHWTESRV